MVWRMLKWERSFLPRQGIGSLATDVGSDTLVTIDGANTIRLTGTGNATTDPRRFPAVKLDPFSTDLDSAHRRATVHL
jgi:hypothetical protein